MYIYIYISICQKLRPRGLLVSFNITYESCSRCPIRIPELTVAPVVTTENGKERHHEYRIIYTCAECTAPCSDCTT